MLAYQFAIWNRRSTGALERRHVDAHGFFGERVSGHGPCARAVSAADHAVLADAALAPEFVGIAQLVKDETVSINIDHALPAHVARPDRQKSARVDVADMRDEHEALAVVHALRRPLDAIGVLETGAAHLEVAAPLVRPHRAAGPALPLDGHAAEMLRGGDFDVKGHLVLQIAKPVKNPLMLGRRNHVLPLAAAHRHQEKYAPLDGAESLDAPRDFDEVSDVRFGHGRVDLQGDLEVL